MTVNDLIEQVRILYDETITEAQAVAWVNECQQSDLMADCLISGNTTVNVTTDTWADLPSDFLKVGRIEDGNSCRYIGSYELLTDSGQIKFPETNTYTIYYYKMPSVVSSGTDVPEAHESLHYPMVHYLYAKYQFKENGPDDIKGNKAISDYAMFRDNILTNLKRMATSGQTAGVVR